MQRNIPRIDTPFAGLPDKTKVDDDPECRKGEDSSVVRLRDLVVSTWNGRKLLYVHQAHQTRPRTFEMVKVVPIIINQERMLVDGKPGIVRSVMLEKAQQVSKERGVWLDAYKLPRQTLSEERNTCLTDLTTLDDGVGMRMIVTSMMVGMFGLTADELNGWSVNFLNVFEDVEFDRASDGDVRDVRFLLMATIVTAKVGDPGNSLIDRKDPCGRKWFQLPKDQVEKMENMQFDPRMSKHAIMEAFKKLEK